MRTIDLIDPAAQYLRQQMQESYLQPTLAIYVIQRDDQEREGSLRIPQWAKQHALEPVQPQPMVCQPIASNWCSAPRPEPMPPHICQPSATSYVPIEWVARQLGHSDTGMVKKHYGRWIPSDTKSMAGMVSQMMGFRDAENGL